MNTKSQIEAAGTALVNLDSSGCIGRPYAVWHNAAALVDPLRGVVGRSLPVYTGGLDWSEYDSASDVDAPIVSVTMVTEHTAITTAARAA